MPSCHLANSILQHPRPLTSCQNVTDKKGGRLRDRGSKDANDRGGLVHDLRELVYETARDHIVKKYHDHLQGTDRQKGEGLRIGRTWQVTIVSPLLGLFPHPLYLEVEEECDDLEVNLAA